MMRLAFVILGCLLPGSVSGADIPIPRPAPPESVPSECARNFPLKYGDALPVVLFDQRTLKASCSAVVVPLSDYADLLTTEEWASAIALRYRIDTTQLEMERDWYQEHYEEAAKPPPWSERPATQRWAGRIETLITVGLVGAVIAASYKIAAER